MKINKKIKLLVITIIATGLSFNSMASQRAKAATCPTSKDINENWTAVTTGQEFIVNGFTYKARVDGNAMFKDDSINPNSTIAKYFIGYTFVPVNRVAGVCQYEYAGWTGKYKLMLEVVAD